MEFSLPEDLTAEITLIGTGGGYGESIIVHIGNKNWIIIDSCIDPSKKSNLPLDYLKKIGVNLVTDVKMIVCTHWHDDHIQGISQLLDECKNSIFGMARPNDGKKFLQLVELDYRKAIIKTSNSSTIEFQKCLEILSKRDHSKRKNAEVDKLLLSIELPGNLKSDVISLSPSSYTMSEFDKEISALITEYGQSSKKIIPKSPNSKSVVLYLKIGAHRAILGADLEVTNDNKEGWLNILDHAQSLDKAKKASLFKIPHHGSINGYSDRIWIELLDNNPVSKITPWNKNYMLPTSEMLEKYCDHTDSLYITSLEHENKNKPKNRDRSIEKMIKNMNFKIREVKFNLGIIRCRISMQNENDKWNISLHGHSTHVNPLF
jgi:beta-lactamase superfamily II metal-dependent hydrolase